MSWPLSNDALAAFGQQAVADSAGAIAGASVAFGELNLTGRAWTIRSVPYASTWSTTCCR